MKQLTIRSKQPQAQLRTRLKIAYINSKKSILTMITVMAEFWAIISDPFMIVAVIVPILKTRQKVDTRLYR